MKVQIAEDIKHHLFEVQDTGNQLEELGVVCISYDLLNNSTST